MLVVIGCAAIIIAYALPSLTRGGKAKLPQVIGNLKQIDLAKQMWASDHAATNGAVVTEQELTQYLRVPGRTGLVAIVDSETYRANVIGTPPEAQLRRSFGPRFPEGTRVRWRTNAGTEILWPNPQGGANGWQPLYRGTNRTPAEAAPRRSP